MLIRYVLLTGRDMGKLARSESGVLERAIGASAMPALIVRAGGQAERNASWNSSPRGS
jgi:hypothetical protein